MRAATQQHEKIGSSTIWSANLLHKYNGDIFDEWMYGAADIDLAYRCGEGLEW